MSPGGCDETVNPRGGGRGAGAVGQPEALDERRVVVDPCAATGRSDPGDNLVARVTRRFPGQEAPVDLEHDAVRHEVHAGTAADRAQAERGRAARMLWVAVEQLEGERLDGGDGRRRAIDRVVAALGVGAVAGAAVDAHPPAHRAFVLCDEGEFGRLRDDRERRRAREQSAGRFVARRRRRAAPEASRGPGAAEAAFLVHRRDEDDRRLTSSSRPREPLERHEHRGEAALHVAGTAPMQAAVAHQRSERVDRHPVRRHGVLMGIPQHDRGAGTRGLEAGDDVVTARGYRLTGPGDSGRGKPLGEVVGDPAFEVLRARHVAAHRIDAWTADQIGESGRGGRDHGVAPYQTSMGVKMRAEMRGGAEALARGPAPGVAPPRSRGSGSAAAFPGPRRAGNADGARSAQTPLPAI